MIGLANLEGVIKCAIESLYELLDSEIERYILSTKYCRSFLLAQAQFPDGISYNKSLSEKDLNEYIRLYILNCAVEVKALLDHPGGIGENLIAEIDFEIVREDILKRIVNLTEQRRGLNNCHRNDLESVLGYGIEDYYKYYYKSLGRNATKQINHLSNMRYQATYIARLNCPEMITKHH